MNNSLENFIRLERERKEILLMAHLVLGYPSLESNFETVAALVSAGVELIELQFPHSEPMADGPVIAQANQISLSRGISIDDCFSFAKEVTSKFPSTKFLAMTYLNIVFKRTFESFCREAVSAGLSGLIVADLTIETSSDLEKHCKSQGLSPIFIYTPLTDSERMKSISSKSSGLIYCVARRGVTGTQSDFSGELLEYLARARKSTSLPLAVGFGISSKSDVDFLRGHSDIAVIGTKGLTISDEQGPKALESFMRSLRE